MPVKTKQKQTSEKQKGGAKERKRTKKTIDDYIVLIPQKLKQ